MTNRPAFLFNDELSAKMGDTLDFNWEVPHHKGKLYFVESVDGVKKSAVPVSDIDSRSIKVDGNATFSLKDDSGAIKTVRVQIEGTPMIEHPR